MKNKLPTLGLMGKMGSGKGYASKYLAKKYGYKIIGMGNIVRAVARKERMKPTRENLESLQKKYSKNGKDFVIEKLKEKIKSTWLLKSARACRPRTTPRVYGRSTCHKISAGRRCARPISALIAPPQRRARNESRRWKSVQRRQSGQ